MEHLKRFILWFINGVALTCGAWLVVTVSSHFENNDKQKDDKPLIDPFRRLPDGTVQVSSVEIIPISDKLSVSGSIASSEKTQLDLWLQLNILQGGQVIYTCGRRTFEYTTPGKPQRVQIDCPNLRRVDIPKGAALAVQVSKVSARAM